MCFFKDSEWHKILVVNNKFFLLIMITIAWVATQFKINKVQTMSIEYSTFTREIHNSESYLFKILFSFNQHDSITNLNKNKIA